MKFVFLGEMKSQPDLLGAMDFIEELEKNPEGVSKLPNYKTVLWLTVYMESIDKRNCKVHCKNFEFIVLGVKNGMKITQFSVYLFHF